MGAPHKPDGLGGSSTVEFVDGVTATEASDSPSGRRARSRWQMAAVIASVAALYVGFLAWPRSEETTPATVHNIGVHFGDPFAIDWVELTSASPQPTGDDTRPLPMAGVHPPCVGFARPDWPVESRHPTVARCIDGEDLAHLTDDGTVGVWQVVAGAETWHFFYFADAMSDLEATLADGTTVEADRLYVGGRFAAALLPTDSTGTTMSWRLGFGGLHDCRLDRQPSGQLVCGGP